MRSPPEGRVLAFQSGGQIPYNRKNRHDRIMLPPGRDRIDRGLFLPAPRMASQAAEPGKAGAMQGARGV